MNIRRGNCRMIYRPKRIVECDGKDLCKHDGDSIACDACLRNAYHIRLKDNFEQNIAERLMKEVEKEAKKIFKE